jgi:hypothetical protein
MLLKKSKFVCWTVYLSSDRRLISLDPFQQFWFTFVLLYAIIWFYSYFVCYIMHMLLLWFWGFLCDFQVLCAVSYIKKIWLYLLTFALQCKNPSTALGACSYPFLWCQESAPLRLLKPSIHTLNTSYPFVV